MAHYQLATHTWDGAEERAIQEVVSSGRYTMGERVKNFEQAFAKWTGSKYAVMVNSGSSANLLAVASQFYRKDNPLKPGDEVIVPAVSWSTTYFPLAQYGLKLVFVDVDPNTLNLSLSALADAITERTRAIFAVNLLGNPNDFTQLYTLINKKDIILLEDNCESMGARFDGKRTGTFGEIGTHSSFFSHHMCTMEGGIAVTDNEALYHIMLCLRAHGWLRDLPEKNHVCDKLGDPFLDSFRFALPGYCLRPTEMQGAIGSAQLPKQSNFIDKRRANAAQFVQRFGQRDDLRVQQEVGESSWFGFSLVLTERATYERKALVDTLKAHQVECRPIVAGDFTQNPVISHIPHRIHANLRHTQWIHEHGVMVGNNTEDLSEQFDLLETALSKLSNKVASPA